MNVSVYVQTLYQVQSMLSYPPSDQKLNTLSDPGNYDKYFQTINKTHLHASLQEKINLDLLGRSTNTKDV